MDELYFMLFHGQLGRECQFARKAKSEKAGVMQERQDNSDISESDQKVLLDPFFYAVESARFDELHLS